MYGCWAFPINFKKYGKREEEIDAILKGFGEEAFSFDDDYEPLDAAYLIELSIEDEYEGYYVAVVGDSHFNAEELCDVVFGLEEEYATFNILKDKQFEKLSEEEKMKVAYLALRYPMIEGDDIDGLEELLNGEEVSYGKIVKRIF